MAIEMGRLPREFEVLTPYELWELLAAFKLRAEALKRPRKD